MKKVDVIQLKHWYLSSAFTMRRIYFTLTLHLNFEKMIKINSYQELTDSSYSFACERQEIESSYAGGF